MQTSAKSTWEVVQKLSSDKQQSTLIHEFGNPLGIPCWAVLHWLSRGLCHARKCQLKEFCVEKGMIHDRPMDIRLRELGERRNGERKPVLIFVPGSNKHLALRKRVMCARNMGAHVRCSTQRTNSIKKTGWEISAKPRKYLCIWCIGYLSFMSVLG